MSRLDGKRIAIIATHGFEQSELFSPKQALEEAGARTDVVSFEEDEIRGVEAGEKGRSIAVDKIVKHADINDYDGLLIPGGLYSPDALRQDEQIVAFVRNAFARSLPVGAICHGPQVLISAEVVEGRKLTGYRAVQIDLENAGATVLDEEVVVDRGLVTSRSPNDLPAFNARIVEEFAEGRHKGQKQSVIA